MRWRPAEPYLFWYKTVCQYKLLVLWYTGTKKLHTSPSTPTRGPGPLDGPVKIFDSKICESHNVTAKLPWTSVQACPACGHVASESRGILLTYSLTGLIQRDHQTRWTIWKPARPRLSMQTSSHPRLTATRGLALVSGASSSKLSIR